MPGIAQMGESVGERQGSRQMHLSVGAHRAQDAEDETNDNLYYRDFICNNLE